MNKLKPRCKVCGTYLFNYDSQVLLLCTEHRTKLPDNYMKEWRKVVRTKLGSPTKTSENEA